MTIRVVNVRGLKGADREGIVYVGRAFAGWPRHKLANPFRVTTTIDDCLDRYVLWLHSSAIVLEADLAELWEHIEHGAKPLGCWCVGCTLPDNGQYSWPIVCHAQILALELAKRFLKETNS